MFQLIKMETPDVVAALRSVKVYLGRLGVGLLYRTLTVCPGSHHRKNPSPVRLPLSLLGFLLLPFIIVFRNGNGAPLELSWTSST